MRLIHPFKHRFHIDYETRSKEDITSVGRHKYFGDRDFKILMMSYAMDDEPVKLYECYDRQLPRWFVKDILPDPTILKTAYEAPFEIGATEHELGIRVDRKQWECAKIMAAMAGYPMSLSETAKAMKLETLKDTRGTQLITLFTQPAKERDKKRNGGHDWNYPEYFPEQWEEFCQYCIQDTVVERNILLHPTVADMPDMPADEREYWLLDQRINDRGIGIDLDLVKAVIEIHDEHIGKLVREGTHLTGLDNVKSDAQLKSWLHSNDCMIPNMQKDTVMEMLGHPKLSGRVKRILEIRTETSKSSMTKYNAMVNCCHRLNRVYGGSQFYGANRTGRNAGRIVNTLNMVKNKLKKEKLAQARELVRAKMSKTLALLFGKLSFVLSQLTRTVFIPKAGHKFVISDFASIESRVGGYLAGAEWKLKAFREGKDIYLVNASAMYGLPYEELDWPKEKGKHPLREPAKVGELACIAEGQLVLTDIGLIPIEKVSKYRKVWDGSCWVITKGVIFKGIKKVIEYDGLRATEDHLVWVEGMENPVEFAFAARSGANIVKTGFGRKGLRKRDYNLSGKKMAIKRRKTLRLDQVQQMPSRRMGVTKKYRLPSFRRMREMLSPKTNSSLAGTTTRERKEQMSKSETSRLSELRSERNRISIRKCIASRTVSIEKFPGSNQRFRIGSQKQRGALRRRKPSFYYANAKQRESPCNSNKSLGSGMLAILPDHYHQFKKKRAFKGRDFKIRLSMRRKENNWLPKDCGEVKVYDLLNCGPNNRFTVSGCLVHNCQYGSGEPGMIAGGALKSGQLKETDLPDIKKKWRKINPETVQAWEDIEIAARGAINDPGGIYPCCDGKVKYMVQHGNLLCKLPSGRTLSYVNVGIKEVTRENGFYDPSKLVKWIEEKLEVQLPNFLWMLWTDEDFEPTRQQTKDLVEFVDHEFGKEVPWFIQTKYTQKIRTTEAIIYEGMQERGKGQRVWGVADTWAGKLFENIVQAVSRDILFHAMLNLDDEGIDTVLHVYDETVNEVPMHVTVEEVNRIMEIPVPWAPEIPLKAEGFESLFYLKE